MLLWWRSKFDAGSGLKVETKPPNGAQADPSTAYTYAIKVQ